jgi:flavin reductase (DIM6/NTAB) family NADH-FMN oxidoreductase RutF
VTDASFDRFARPLDYPMFVLTVPGADRGPPSGCLVGFATQCSIAPPRVLACVSTANHTYRSAARVGVAAVHLLTVDTRDLAVLFGTETGDEVDKFARCAWSQGPEGVPLLARCPAWLAGRIDARLDLGDHHGLLLAPIAVGPGADREPLMLSAVASLTAGHPVGDS